LVDLQQKAEAPAVENPRPVSLRERIAAAREPEVLATLSLTAIGLGAGFVLFTYIDPLLRSLTGYGGRGVSVMLLLFGVAAIAGNALGGYGADRWGYGRSLVIIFSALAASFLPFSLLAPASGTFLAVAGVGVVLVAWSVAGWALTPFQQYRLIRLSPEQSNLVLSLNASAIYLGQGLGAGLGALVLLYGSLDSLGWVSAICAAIGLVILVLGTRPPAHKIPSNCCSRINASTNIHPLLPVVSEWYQRSPNNEPMSPPLLLIGLDKPIRESRRADSNR
jgi:predicted MFS family arabinose efflux permease